MSNSIQRSFDLTKPKLKALYARIGGEERLGRILDDFYSRMQSDLMIGFYFAGRDIRVIAARQKEFLLRAMGATPSYTGKPPAHAHEAMPPILPGHFDRRLRILEAVLRDHGLPAEDIRTWIEFEEAFRAAVVVQG